MSVCVTIGSWLLEDENVIYLYHLPLYLTHPLPLSQWSVLTKPVFVK